MNEYLVDRKYRNLLFKCLDHPPQFIGTHKNPRWQMDCPICGAWRSQLVWIEQRNTYKFVCPSNSRRNCGLHAEFPVLLKVWNPALYLQFVQEREDEGTVGVGFNCPRVADIAPQRRSRRQLKWRKCQVPDQVNEPSDDGS